MRKRRTNAATVFVAGLAVAWMVSRWPEVEQAPPLQQRVLGPKSPLEPYLGPGELLTFELSLWSQAVGTATLKLTTGEFEGRAVHRAVAHVRSSPALASLYTLDDHLESFIDPEIGAPLKYVKTINEGTKQKVDWIEIDQNGHRAVHRRAKRYTDKKDGKEKLWTYTRGEHDVPEGVQDPLSAYYHLRKIELAVGDEVKIPVTEDRRSCTMIIRVVGREKLHLPRLGAIDALVIEPEMDYKGLFGSGSDTDKNGKPVEESEKAQMWIDAQTHVLLKIVAPVSVGGKLTGILVKVENTERPSPEQSDHNRGGR